MRSVGMPINFYIWLLVVLGFAEEDDPSVLWFNYRDDVLNDFSNVERCSKVDIASRGGNTPAEPYIITDLFPAEILEQWQPARVSNFLSERGIVVDQKSFTFEEATEDDQVFQPIMAHAANVFRGSKFSGRVLLGGAHGSHFAAHNHAMVLLLVTEGSKKWYLAEGDRLLGFWPDSTKEFFGNVSHQTVLRAGETMVLPRGWWHYVANFERSSAVQLMFLKFDPETGGWTSDEDEDEL